MATPGFFDVGVGIEYMPDNAIRGTELWYTRNDFTFFIGPVSDQRYVTVPAGFVTDGATVPRMFWSIFPPWGIYGQAAVLHDFLCTNRKLTKNGDSDDLDVTQAESDKIFYKAMKVLKTPLWKRAVIYASVRVWNAWFA